MAKDICVSLKFDSNGQVVLGQLTLSAKELQNAVKGVQKQTKSVFKDLMSSTSAAVVAINGVSESIGNLAAPYNTFDQAMRRANTMAGKSGKEFEKLRDQVKDLASKYGLARDVLANGLYETISNGVSENNWMSYLEQSAKTSIGATAELGSVVGVVATVIKNYGVEWEKAGTIQDMIQLAAVKGKTSFEEMANALPRVTTNAAKLGISIDELLAAFSTLTGVTGNTNEASTQLAAVLTALVKPSREAQKMAKAMGIEFNAASIKSAGGLQNFLVTLDQAVQNYASANNVLADEVYGKLFGSAESLRALGALTGQLSDKYQENVAAMQNSAGTIEAAHEGMAASGEQASQRMRNSFENLTDGIGSWASKVQPISQMVTNLGISFIGLCAVIKTVKFIFTGFISVIVKIKTVLPLLVRWVRTARLALQMLALSSRGAAIAVNVLKYAIKGLMAATVIGVILMAIGAAMEYFVNKTGEASGAIDESKKEFEDWKKSLTDLSGLTEQSVAQEITALDRLYKAATDETKSREERVKAADKLRTVYKDTFGNLKTEAILAGKAADEYNKLKDSIIETATARAAEKKIEQNRSKWIDLDVERTQLEGDLASNGARLNEAKKRESNLLNQYIEESETAPIAELEKKAVEARAAVKVVQNLEEERDKMTTRLKEIKTAQGEIDKKNDELSKYAETPTATSSTTYNNLTDLLNDNDTDKTLKQKLEAQLSAAKERYVTASMAGNESEAAGIKTVIDGLRQQISKIELIEKMAERPATLTTLEDINAEIQYQQALRQRASDENRKAIDAEIDRLEKQRQAMEDASYTVKSVEEIKTYEDLEKARQHYQNKMKTASEAERIEIQKNINKLDELEEKWNEALAELKAPGDLASLDTLEKLSKALSYFQAKLEKASPDKVPGLVKMMEGIKEAQVLAQRPVSIATARYETDRISGLDEKTKKQKIRAIGYDELTNKIAELQAMLDDTEHPLLESQRDEVTELIGIYSQWKKMSTDTWGAVTQGISTSASMMSNLAGVVKGAAAEWLSSIGQIMESLAQLIPLLLTVTGIKAMESAAETPIVGWLMVGAAAAAVIAAFASLPKFADGGIAYGPTIGMFGEYPGAGNNPEVVAPLNKLRSLIEPAGIDGGKVEFEIEGTKLKGVLARVEKRSSRS